MSNILEDLLTPGTGVKIVPFVNRTLGALIAVLLFSVAPEIFPYWDDFAKIDYHRASAAEGTVARLKMKYVNSQFQFYQTLTSAGSMLLLSQFGSDVTFLTSLKEDDEKSL